MAIATLGELLDRGAEFEALQERFYATVRDSSSDSGVRLLTYYLARHRRHQAHAMEDLDPELIKHLRKVELQIDLESLMKDVPPLPPKDVTGDQLLESAIRYDTEMVAMYRSIASHPLGEEAHAFIESLIRLEESDIVMMKKMLAMHYF